MCRSRWAAGDTSRIYYSHNNSIPANVPFPEDATEIVYDENRPYLRCVTGLSVEAALEFFNKGLAAEGWAPLAASAIEARWPNAKLNDAVENGRRVYFSREGREQRQQPPVMLTLQRGAGDKTVVDLRIAPFALPQDLTNARDSAGLPSPDKIKQAGSTGSADSVRREATALVIADMPVVLAFYRREMTLRGWTEQAGTTINDTGVKATFTQPDGTAVLEMRPRYDLVSVRIVAQLREAAVAARAKAKKDADAKWMSDAVKQAQELTAASEAKRRAQVAEAAAAPVESLRGDGQSVDADPAAGECGRREVRRQRGQARFHLAVHAEVGRHLLSRDVEAARLEGRSRRDQRADDVLDGLHQGRAGARHHRDAVRWQGEGVRQRHGPAAAG